MIYRTLSQSEIKKDRISARYSLISGSDFNQSSFDVDDLKYNTLKVLFYNTESNSARIVDYSQSWFLGTNDFYLAEFDNTQIGDLGIIPGSIKMVCDIEGISEVVIDDNYGNLFFGSNFLGNILYCQGLFILDNSTYTINSVQEIDYDVIYEIFTHIFLVKINQTDFNFTTNFSAYDSNGNFIFKDKEFPIFITGINLYDENYELVAVASLPNPYLVDIDTIFEISFVR